MSLYLLVKPHPFQSVVIDADTYLIEVPDNVSPWTVDVPAAADDPRASRSSHCSRISNTRRHLPSPCFHSRSGSPLVSGASGLGTTGHILTTARTGGGTW